MAPKNRGHREATPAAAAAPLVATSPASPAKPSTKVSSNQAQNWDKVMMNIYDHYMQTTPQRTKLIDSFMAFLAVVGALQFLYCVLAGNYVRLSLPHHFVSYRRA
jgi:oligosaccharyltransferase complex subunit epsilon